jgi:hypothetical protein
VLEVEDEVPEDPNDTDLDATENEEEPKPVASRNTKAADVRGCGGGSLREIKPGIRIGIHWSA